MNRQYRQWLRRPGQELMTWAAGDQDYQQEKRLQLARERYEADRAEGMRVVSVVLGDKLHFAREWAARVGRFLFRVRQELRKRGVDPDASGAGVLAMSRGDHWTYNAIQHGQFLTGELVKYCNALEAVAKEYVRADPGRVKGCRAALKWMLSLPAGADVMTAEKELAKAATTATRDSAKAEPPAMTVSAPPAPPPPALSLAEATREFSVGIPPAPDNPLNPNVGPFALPADEAPPVPAADDVDGGGYDPAHPFYYRLGGRRLLAEEIQRHAEKHGAEDPAAAARCVADIVRFEHIPKRQLESKDRWRKILANLVAQREADVERYQELVRAGDDRAKQIQLTPPAYLWNGLGDCATPYEQALALAHNHIYSATLQIWATAGHVDKLAEETPAKHIIITQPPELVKIPRRMRRTPAPSAACTIAAGAEAEVAKKLGSAAAAVKPWPRLADGSYALHNWHHETFYGLEEHEAESGLRVHYGEKDTDGIPVEQWLSTHNHAVRYLLHFCDLEDDYRYLDRRWLLQILYDVAVFVLGSHLSNEKPGWVDNPLYNGRNSREQDRVNAFFHAWCIGKRLQAAAKEARMIARAYKRANPEILRLQMQTVEQLATCRDLRRVDAWSKGQGKLSSPSATGPKVAAGRRGVFSERAINGKEANETKQGAKPKPKTRRDARRH